MKITKNFIAIVLCLLLLITSFATVSAEESEFSGIVSKTVKVAENGDVEVLIDIAGNPGIMALLIGFEFDAEQLQYAGFEKGKVFSDYEIAENDGELKLMCLENEDVKGDGELVTLKFKVVGKNNAKTDVKVVIEDNSICNYDEELIKATGENGTVKIKK